MPSSTAKFNMAVFAIRGLSDQGHEDVAEGDLTRARGPVYLTQRLSNRSVEYMAADQLSLTFAALADPTRRAILARLASGDCSVTELAEPFDMSMPAVSKHLRVLERAGLIARGREAQWRPCRIEAAPLKQVADWTERYRAIWEQRFDRLETYLQELKVKEKRDGRKQRRK
jgi:DNA-binding transcriptional ArsR family regulator